MTVTAEPPATAEGPGGKGLKSGALGLLSSVVIGVASTAPAYSPRRDHRRRRRDRRSSRRPIVMVIAFVPMLFIASPTTSSTGPTPTAARRSPGRPGRSVR